MVKIKSHLTKICSYPKTDKLREKNRKAMDVCMLNVMEDFPTHATSDQTLKISILYCLICRTP